jgi:RHS repeat-associated protein
VTLQLANLHGDIAATLPVGASSPAQLAVTDTTEYGLPRTAPAAGSTQARYGWLGTHQRDTSTPGGLTLMGVRLYTPTVGRFLTVDPIEGGSANDYDYAAADPVNLRDLDGRHVRRAGHVQPCFSGLCTSPHFRKRTNKEIGDIAERIVYGLLRRAFGPRASILPQFRVWTPLGHRFIDFLVISRGFVRAYEVKANSARRNPVQLWKDHWIERSHGIRTSQIGGTAQCSERIDSRQ